MTLKKFKEYFKYLVNLPEDMYPVLILRNGKALSHSKIEDEPVMEFKTGEEAIGFWVGLKSKVFVVREI